MTQVVLITGDAEPVAASVAAELGIAQRLLRRPVSSTSTTALDPFGVDVLRRHVRALAGGDIADVIVTDRVSPSDDHPQHCRAVPTAARDRWRLLVRT